MIAVCQYRFIISPDGDVTKIRLDESLELDTEKCAKIVSCTMVSEDNSHSVCILGKVSTGEFYLIKQYAFSSKGDAKAASDLAEFYVSRMRFSAERQNNYVGDLNDLLN